ncbi:hypothetical protein TTHERM_00564510 (macronuclear) [Tetrahymena thermophila SB210]|uniref:Uncharacterized protein n=1 Tax=Tetrahymena thermophila (strain SB210) TaxID=312017 RepID=I7LWH4_TETTS|nr:hypothetical protein TTHERM_00564510 [Tetrahymena thermophila SB210]EAS01805.1 hypothetical protein TTHERM_00564510 [Tetrahymena thermophila SB210]|eukprot:XP_001022050.1 hypothetical protein TTHERM_00564510 [Tetrahymena thermophila SB210]
MHSQFMNNSISNSIIDLNNMMQYPQNSANKFQNNISKVNDSIFQILPGDQKSVNQPSVLNNTKYKGKFVLAKRLSESNLHNNNNNQQKCPPIQVNDKLKQDNQAQILSTQKRSCSNNTSMPNIQKPVMNNQKQNNPAISKLNEELERAMKNNIFNVKDQNLSNQFVEYNQGPRFRDGKIVPYTIVGSPQLFTKYHNLEEQKNSIKDQLVNVIRQPRKKNTFKYTDSGTNQNLLLRKNSQIQLNATGNFNNSNLNQTNSENSSDIRLNTNYQHKSSFKKSSTYAMNNSGINNMKKKYRNTDFDEVSKEELIHEMNLALLRIKQNEEEQLKKENQMNFEQRMLLNREQRILEKYNKTVTQWVKDISKLSDFSHRKPEDSLMIKSDDYRKKIEIFNAFDSLRSDEQRFGQRIWYMMLRKNNVKSDNKIVNTNDILKNVDNDQDVYLSKSNIRKFVNYTQQQDISKLKDPQIFDPREQTQSDIFSNFMTVTVNNPYKPIEVVRKSVGEKKCLNLTNNNFNQSQSSYFMNTQTYLENKIQENIHLLKNRIVIPNDENMQDLLIQGKNLYEIENKSLLTDGNPNNYKYEKLNVIRAANNQILNSSNNNNYKSSDVAHSVKESAQQSQHDLDDEVVYEKQYDVGELSKTGYYFFKDL